MICSSISAQAFKFAIVWFWGDSSIRVLSHAGHFPMLERPKEFNDKLAAMIGEVAEMKKGK